MKQLRQFLLAAAYMAATGGWVGQPLMAQSGIISDTLRVNALRARMQSNGALFVGGNNGMLLAPATPGGNDYFPLMRGSGLWLGGKDQNGAIHLAAQMYNEGGKADFFPGALDDSGTPSTDFNLIAAVSADEIDAHRSDPNTFRSGVYGWPGLGNPSFFAIHGFEIPFIDWGLAGYYDRDEDAIYEPAHGDFPAVELRGCPLDRYSDAMRWTSFQDAGTHTQSGALPLKVEAHEQVLGFQCMEGSPADRTLFVFYTIAYRGDIPLDSAYFGVFLDFEIGNGADDYIGCNLPGRYVYAYNGDAVDEGGFESAPPVVAVDLLRGPLNDIGEEVQQWHFIPLDAQALNNPQAYYNQLAGRRPNGVTFPNDGLVYFGNPLNPNEWNEARDGNSPGERKAIASFGPFTLYPGAVNEIALAYTWVRKAGTGALTDNLSVLDPTMNAIQGIFDNCMELDQGCPPAVAVNEPVFSEPNWMAYPNPFNDRISLEGAQSAIKSVRLYDATGKLVKEWLDADPANLNLPAGRLPAGMYLLKVLQSDGRMNCQALIKG